MRKKYVAINYRKDGDPVGDHLQGAWKEFITLKAASAWLNHRQGKTLTSPKGVICFEIDKDIEHLKEILISDRSPLSLKLAVGAYLEYRIFR